MFGALSAAVSGACVIVFIFALKEDAYFLHQRGLTITLSVFGVITALVLLVNALWWQRAMAYFAFAFIHVRPLLALPRLLAVIWSFSDHRTSPRCWILRLRCLRIRRGAGRLPEARWIRLPWHRERWPRPQRGDAHRCTGHTVSLHLRARQGGIRAEAERRRLRPVRAACVLFC